MASSETMAGDAEPTWWTCSSTLGRPAMKAERGATLTPLSLSGPERVERTDHDRGQQTEQQPGRQDPLEVDRPHPGHRHQPDHAGDEQEPGARAGPVDDSGEDRHP